MLVHNFEASRVNYPNIRNFTCVINVSIVVYSFIPVDYQTGVLWHYKPAYFIPGMLWCCGHWVGNNSGPGDQGPGTRDRGSTFTTLFCICNS